MLKSQKHVFWEAFIIAIVIFILGMLLGYSFELSKVDNMNDYYAQSEVSLMDVLTFRELLSDNNTHCDILIKSNIELADKIYHEARILERYDDSRKISETLKYVHQRYDLLRTLLWINTAEIKEKCKKNFSSVVYLYDYTPEDLTKKANQAVWSKVLFDLKQKEGENLILIPIASSRNLVSLNTLVSNFNITNYPVVIINDKYVIYEIKSVEDIEKYLENS
ncbi:MAG TPA: hypothetical protein VJH65_03810 [Candidatus Nanoarchaeia archaeon]|nr:hypothetical protein [Candidatus Nanoarchaeia archaeon]